METWLIVLALVVVAFLGAPIFAVLGAIALIAFGAEGTDSSAIIVEMFRIASAPALLAIPLFTLMAQIMAKGGVGDDLFDFVHVWLRHLPGGLAITTVVACSLFAAICGSSTATALISNVS